ncbi:MAG: CoA pyrophosphatase [Hyphomicrobiaceae bacterium]|nr:CoA pyrophosphatase [Hyphomicrobiaceae bacterium]MCC0023307.1 CoA pyrophosphatase [Hyphomicrobiaceae bacterium]
MHDDGAVITHIRRSLLDEPMPLDQAMDLEPDWVPDIPFIEAPKPAAVLIALVERDGGHTVVYTERSSSLRAHSGQVAFPGGKLDRPDEPPHVAALREAEEEVALEVAGAEVLGYMPPYYTGTNYLITPVVARVRQSKAFVANPGEVDEVFEVPLAHLRRKSNFKRHSVRLRGRSGHTWRIDYDQHVIWGITANLTRRFHDMALAEPSHA